MCTECPAFTSDRRDHRWRAPGSSVALRAARADAELLDLLLAVRDRDSHGTWCEALKHRGIEPLTSLNICLLYTSDAADK